MTLPDKAIHELPNVVGGRTMLRQGAFHVGGLPEAELHSPLIVNHIYGTGRGITARPEHGKGLSGFPKRPYY